MSYPNRQINVLPHWAVSGTAEAPRPSATDRASGLAIGGDFDYQTANWLYKTQGDNLGKLREQFVFSDLNAGFFIGGTIPTTGANYDNVRICQDEGSGGTHFVSGRNTTAAAYEVYRFGTAGGAGTIYSNSLPAGFIINDLSGDTLGTRHVFAVGEVAGASAAYIATAANTWTNVGATYYPNAPGPLHRLRRVNVNSFLSYLFTVGNAGGVFIHQGSEPGVSTKLTPPTGMSAVNFRGIAAGLSGAVPYGLFFGDSRHIMTVTIASPPTHTVSVLSNALPSTVSSVNAVVCAGRSAYLVAGGVRTDGKAFLAVSENCGASWDEVPPEVHGITATITDMSLSVQGAVLVVAGGALFGGFPDPLSPWKKLYEAGYVSDLVNWGNDMMVMDERTALGGTRIYLGATGTSSPRLPYAAPRFYAERTFP